MIARRLFMKKETKLKINQKTSWQRKKALFQNTLTHISIETDVTTEVIWFANERFSNKKKKMRCVLPFRFTVLLLLLFSVYTVRILCEKEHETTAPNCVQWLIYSIHVETLYGRKGEGKQIIFFLHLIVEKQPHT